MENWILTDDDSFQHVRKLDETTFEVIDICGSVSGRYTVLLVQVALNEHDLGSPAFIDEYLNPYGYSSMAEMQEIYVEAASQIVAECIFETNPFSFGEIVSHGTFDECRVYIYCYLREGEQ